MITNLIEKMIRHITQVVKLGVFSRQSIVLILLLAFILLAILFFLLRIMHRLFRKKIIYSIILYLLIILFIGYLCYRKTPALHQNNDNNNIESGDIKYSAERNFRQTYNACGPFSTAAVLRVLGTTGTENLVDNSTITENMKRRVTEKQHTLPQGIESYLKDSGISCQSPNLYRFTDTEKILYLRQELATGNPIIILGDLDGYQHFITLLGYDTTNDSFLAYDSIWKASASNIRFTIDTNGSNPGNRSLSNSVLIDFWSGGGRNVFYKYYALVCSSN